MATDMNLSLAKLSSIFFGCIVLVLPISVYSDDIELDATLFESSELMQSGQVVEALALLKGVETKYSNSREYLNNLAVAYLGNSQPEEALSILRQLVDNDPLYSIIAHNLLEMELQISETRPENIKPVLFVQTVDSFFTGEIAELQSPETRRTDIAETSSVASAAAPAQTTSLIRDTPSNSSGVSSQQQIQHGIIAKAVISNWSNAWSNKDYTGYISSYAPEFISSKGQGYEQWAESRKWALNKPGNILVQASNLETESVSPDEIIAIFDQAYESSNYSDKVQKELTLVRQNADWKILKEVTLKTY